MVAVLGLAAPAGARGRPDLTVTRVSVAGVKVVAGSCAGTGCGVRLTVSARIVNRGSRGAGRARTGFFLSKDARHDRKDHTAGRAWVKAIARRRQRRSRARLSLNGVAPGRYRLIACADITRRVRERRESNNCRASRRFQVKATAPGTTPAAGTTPAPGTGQAPQPGSCQEPGWRSDMCAEVANAMTNHTFFDMADAVTFVLLYQHHRTKQPIAPSIAAGVIDPLRTAWDPVRGQTGLSTYRVAGFLNFWVYGAYAGVDWARYPDALDTQDEFLSWWQTYGIVQGTARQNAINNSLNGLIESEAAWQKAFNDWKAYDLKLVTAQQYSDATVFAHRTLEDAQTAVLRAENAIQGP